MDRLLDRGANGPLYLRRREIAELVVGALQDGQRKFQRYQLHAFVVMPIMFTFWSHRRLWRGDGWRH